MRQDERPRALRPAPEAGGAYQRRPDATRAASPRSIGQRRHRRL
ncbi:hypothetical protein ACFVU3_01565 [Streptomyces sp. NPDC058052]